MDIVVRRAMELPDKTNSINLIYEEDQVKVVKKFNLPDQFDLLVTFLKQETLEGFKYLLIEIDKMWYKFQRFISRDKDYLNLQVQHVRDFNDVFLDLQKKILKIHKEGTFDVSYFENLPKKQ